MGCCVWKNSSMPHAVPTNKKIGAGDPITIDLGCTKDIVQYDKNNICRICTRRIKPYITSFKNQRQVIKK
ncbi:MAG: M24 family metallopeptidase [Clostridia bacterium]